MADERAEREEQEGVAQRWVLVASSVL